MTDSPLVHEYRKRAVAEIEAVCPAEIGSRQARAVCQGREHWHHYSGCADLYHYTLPRLGLRSPHINRDDPATKANEWIVGVNVGRLVYWPGVAVASFGAVRARNNPAFGPLDIRGLEVDGGDCLIRWSRPDTTDAHVVCVLARHDDDGTLSTAEFGQARPMVGRLFTRSIVPGPGQRPWRVWLPLPAILHACGVGDSVPGNGQ